MNAGLSEWGAGTYGTYYSTINPWMPVASVRKVGIGVVAEQMYSRERLVRTEYYADYMRKLGWESGIGITVVREEGQSFIFTKLTAGLDEASNRAAADVLTRIAPHLRRAFKHFRSGADSGRLLEDTCASLFDAVDFGLVTVGMGLRLRSASPLGQRELASGRCVRLSPLGTVKFALEDATARLVSMLERGYSGPRAVKAAVNGVRVTMVLTTKDEQAAYFQGPTVALMIETSRSSQDLDITIVQALHGLTAAERRALEGLLDGQDVDGIAERAGVSRETVRTQLKGLYAKTGSAGQADLLRKVLTRR